MIKTEWGFPGNISMKLSDTHIKLFDLKGKDIPAIGAIKKSHHDFVINELTIANDKPMCGDIHL